MTAVSPVPAVAVSAVHLACSLGDTPEAVWAGIEGAVRGLTPREPRHLCGQLARPDGAEDSDVALRLAVHHAGAAWAASGLARSALAPDRVAVVLGTTDWGAPDFRHHLADHRDRALARPHTAADAVAGALGLTGPREVFVNGCVASACALGHAADLVRTGRADAVLVGGLNLLDDSVLAAFDSWRALDRAGCSPYRRSAGTSLGEGVAFLVLEPAGRAGMNPLGYLLGHALTGDAHHITAPHPDGEGLARAIRGALADAGIGPELIGYVNGHGTGTRANDIAELRALASVFDVRPPVSSTKSQTGHTLGASGALEAAVTVLALRRHTLPGDPAPAPGGLLASAVGDGRDIADGPARSAPGSARLAPGSAHPAPGLEYALSTSAGFGGQNAALVFGAVAPGGRAYPGGGEVLVTGAGVVHPWATGRAAFLAALRTAGPAIPEAEVADAELAPYIPAADWPRLDPFGRLVTVAARLAEADAGPGTRFDPARIGLVLATASGPVTTHHAMAELHTQGLAPSPLLAPNAVAGVHAGHAAVALNARGPTVVLSAGDASGLLALGQAAGLVRAGRADVVYVIAADEAAPALRAGFAHHGLLAKEAGRPYDVDADGGVLTPAGVALVLESAEHADRRGARVLGRILGHAGAGAPVGPGGVEESGATLARCLADAARRSGITPDDLPHLYGTSWGHPATDVAEARALTHFPGWPANICGATGYTQAAGALLTTLAALEACSDPTLPRRPLTATRRPLPELSRASASAPGRPTAALVTAISRGGTCAAAAVRAP
ncbi:beta-ketoacyl synthase N-terminal-like domain-containing protein [Streptomyces mirabilis]|uniref:beta-ketoacyl synthase N-terminal-like domain-containing protein n=1 Tax=Streptomyces mirabilis TaxID=68239 RepID=UPI0033168BB7